MASKGKIDSIVDIPKIQDEIKFLTGSLDNILRKMEDVSESAASIKLDAFNKSKNLKETAVATAELETAMKDVEQLSQKLNKVMRERADLENRLTKLEQERVLATQAVAKATGDEVLATAIKIAGVYEEVRITKELEKVINDVLGTKQTNIMRLAEEKARLKDVTAAMASNEKAYKAGAKSADEFLNTQSNLIEKQTTLKVAISELSARIKAEEKIEQSAIGTATQKSLILNRLKEAYRNLSEEQKDSVDIGGELLAQIVRLDEGLKEYDATIGNHQRNVGDYAIAGKSMRTELMLLTEQLARMKMEGLENTEAYQEMSRAAGELKDAFDDARSEVKKLASDTGQLDQVISVAEGLAGAYAVVEGASALMGVENEELQKTFVKLQAVMAVLNGLRAIQNVLQKESAAYTLAENVQKKISVLLTYAQNKAETGGIITRKLATAAQWALNAAMAANPAGLLLVALAALVAIGYVMFRVFSSNAEIQKTYSKAIANTKNAVENLNRELDKNVKAMEASGASQQDIIRMKIKAAEQEYDQQSKLISLLLADYKNLSDEQKEQLKELQKVQKENNNKISDLNDDLVNNTIKQNRDAAKLKVDSMKEGLNKELATLKLNYDEQVKAAGDNKELIKAIDKKYYQEVADAQRRAANEYLKSERDTVAKLQEARIGLLKEGFAKELASTRLSFGQKIAELQDQLRTEEKLTADQRKRIKDTIIALKQQQLKEEERLIVEDGIRANEKQIDLINTRLAATRQGTLEEIELRLRSLDLQRANEIAIAEKTGIDVVSINSKYDKLKADESLNFALAQLDKETRQRITAVESGLQKELKLLRDQLENKKINLTEFERQREAIENKYNIKRAENQLDLAQKELDKLKQSGADTLAAEQKLVEAQMALDEAKTANFIANREREKAAQQKLNASTEELGREFVNTMIGLQNADFESRSMQLDELSRKDQEAKERELKNAGDNKAAIEQINAKYAAKEKIRESERRKMELDKAKFAKIASLFQIAINTGVGITKTISEMGMPAAIPFIAATALMGALQASLVAAQPLPKYFKGRDGGPAEWAWVGEEGIEAIEHQGKITMTPDKPTVTFLPAGAKVIPHHELHKISDIYNVQPSQTNDREYYDFARLEDEVRDLKRALINKKEYHLNITELGLRKFVKSGDNYTEYLNRNVRL